MISLIETLLGKGIAYTTSDGVYFSIKKSAGYGALAQLNLSCDDASHDHGAGSAAVTSDAADANSAKGHRVAKDEYEKDDAQDFALWKFHSEDDGEVFWEAPFGKGRPGWHIECSAMAMKALGPTIDIHTGASDLIFPHHTNEIAQSEGVTGKTFVNTWLHAGFLNVDSKKMAKSAGNFYTLPVLMEKGISPLTYRYWLLTAHYRTQINFTEESVLAAGVALERLKDATLQISREASAAVTEPSASDASPDQKYKADFAAAINDDLNISKALAFAWELLKDKSIDPSTKLATLYDFDKVFGLGLKEHVDQSPDAPKALADPDLPADILELAEQRKAARASKDWSTSDKLREELRGKGYEPVDNSDGQQIFRV
ncbi:MAG TPA: cysteine--tRNA ligase, partial [Candidatus Paceibacterota bacterium]